MSHNDSSQSSHRSSHLGSLSSSSKSLASKTSSKTSRSQSTASAASTAGASSAYSSSTGYPSSYPLSYASSAYSSGYWTDSNGSIYGAFSPNVFGLLPDPSNYLRNPSKYLMNGQVRHPAHPYVAEPQRDIRVQLRTTTTTDTIAGFEVTKVVKRYTFPYGSVHETTHTRSEAQGNEANIKELRKYPGQE